MLVVTGTKALGRAHLTMTFVLARGLWLTVIRRDGLVLDTRFAPAARRAPREGTCVYLVERGSFEVHGGPRFEGPVALAFSEQHFEGADGVRELAFRTEGAPFIAVEFHVGARDAGPHASELRSFDLGAAGWARLRALVDVTAGAPDSPQLEAAVEGLVAVLVERALVSASVARELRTPLPYERLLRAVRPIAERFALSATLDELSLSGSASSRQLDRWFREFLHAVPLVGSTWRATTLHLRVKLAVLFLSAPDVTVGEVARAIGYGSTEAMARAFRDARIPSPTVIRDALRRHPAVPRP